MRPAAPRTGKLSPAAASKALLPSCAGAAIPQQPARTNGESAAPIPDALRNFNLLPDDAHVRLPVVAALFACSPATVWRRAGKSLPAPRKLSEKVTAWRVGDLRKALRGEAWQ